MKWDLLQWQQASELMEQAEQIHRNLSQMVAHIEHLGQHGGTGTWVPPVNVVETDQFCWVVTALPGAEADRIDIRLEGNELVIKGIRRLPTCCTEGELKIWEIPPGRFERRLSLIPNGQFTIAESRFDGGLLITQLRKS